VEARGEGGAGEEGEGVVWERRGGGRVAGVVERLKARAVETECHSGAHNALLY